MKRISIRKIREVLRLKFDAGLPVRKIATSLRSSSSGSAGNYLHRFNACVLTWPTPLSDAELERCLFPPAPTVPSDQRPMPDWAHFHAEDDTDRSYRLKSITQRRSSRCSSGELGLKC